MNDLLSLLEPWWRFAAAVSIGALIGLEREFVQQRTETVSFAGIRTFALIALFGALTAFLTQSQGVLIFLAAYGGLVLLVTGNHLVTVYRGRDEGLTTEIAALLTALFGALVIWGSAELAGALGVITALLLSLKPRLHELARRMSAEDLRATMEFALIAAVVLPILPNRTLDPFDVFNPFDIWLLVVLVSGIGFVGYVFMKTLGAGRGTGAIGLLGGIVSSTATSLTLAARSQTNPVLSQLLAWAILLATSVMYPRVMLLSAVVHPPLLRFLALPLGILLLVTLGLAYAVYRRSQVEAGSKGPTVSLDNPLRISAAITFAFVFTAVLVATRLASELFGSTGLFIAGALSGVTGVDSITLSAGRLAENGQITTQAAAVSIVLAILTNTVLKGLVSFSLGASLLRREIALAFGTLTAVGVGVSWVVIATLR